jgi:predicted permease
LAPEAFMRSANSSSGSARVAGSEPEASNLGLPASRQQLYHKLAVNLIARSILLSTIPSSLRAYSAAQSSEITFN